MTAGAQITGVQHPEVDLFGIISISGRPVDPSWIEFGAHSYYARHLSVGAWTVRERVVIGKYCSIADQVTFLAGGNRRTDHAANFIFDTFPSSSSVSLRSVAPAIGASKEILQTLGHFRRAVATFWDVPGYRPNRETRIDHDVWIGYRALILGGVQISSGAVVGAGAVVSRDVPPYAVVVGNPARIVHYRFNPQTVEKLLRICWWDWPDATVAQHAEWFHRPAEEFVARFDSGVLATQPRYAGEL